jgi:protein CrcB
MFTLAVAIGGALGSISRAWMAIAVARITGPQFPWGTILINILGSFVIGFFSSLTAAEDRFPVSTDLRAFVMIGICGGFTTFSSFSLQTLDLIRDGRPFQAFGNVGISVIVCLAAVTAGYYGAVSLNSTRTAATTPASTTQRHVVLAVLHAPKDASCLLDNARDLLQRIGGGQLKALATRALPSTILLSEEILTAEREAAIRAEQENWAAQLHDAVTASAAHAPTDNQTEWLDTEGDAISILTAHGRRADAIVIARHEPAQVRAALFDTETPALIIPPDYHGPVGKIIAIAWQDDGRADKSVRAALPLLHQAQQIHILSADHPAETPAILRERGIQASLHDVPNGPAPTAERILQAAHQLDADLLVMGAYAHGEWREMLFGGVTRVMLAEADLPLFLRH